MSNTGVRRFLGLGMVVVLLAGRTLAQDAASSTNSVGNLKDDNFQPGWREGTAGFGIMFSPIGSSYARPRVDYVPGYIEAGYMLSHIHGSGVLRNNYEIAIEAFGAGIYQSTGHYIAGGTLWLRHNLVLEDSRFVPYAQVGGGLVSMDINHKYDGHNVNFNVDAAGGCRFFVKPKMSLNAEFLYQHISNANTGSHNIGINAVGPILSASWFF